LLLEICSIRLKAQRIHDELHAKTELLEKSELELKAQQDELRQSNEELEEKANMLEDQKEKLENAKIEIETKAREVEVTSKYKSEFLANMSHELRTPLNSILILAQLISENKNNTVGKKEVEFAKNIYNSGNDLLSLINEILDLSKVEAGKIQLEQSKSRETFVKDELGVNVDADFIQYGEAVDNLNTYREDLRSAQENYRIVEKKYYNQLSLLTDMLDASSTKISAELKVADAQIDVIYYYYKLLRTIGTI